MSAERQRRVAAVAATVFALDQASKLVVLRTLGERDERIIIDGFFKFVHWDNTGAAWSFFHGQNDLLAAVSALALAAIYLWRRHFHIHTALGQLSVGLICGGIAGNLFDRIDPSRRHVVDFLRFYMYKRSGEEIGYPAFNVADSAICVGVGLLMLLSWRSEPERAGAPAPRTEG